MHVVLPDSSEKNNYSSASVFIKYASNAQLDNYTPPIKRLINNSIEIIIELVWPIPGSEILPSNKFSQEKYFFGIVVNENSYNKFIILICLLISTNLLQYFINKRKS